MAVHNCGFTERTQSCVTNDDAVWCTDVRYRLLLHEFLRISKEVKGGDGAAERSVSKTEVKMDKICERNFCQRALKLYFEFPSFQRVAHGAEVCDCKCQNKHKSNASVRKNYTLFTSWLEISILLIIFEWHYTSEMPVLTPFYLGCRCSRVHARTVHSSCHKHI